MKFNRPETPSESRVRPYGGMAQRAFTLVEILVVIAIIAVLAALGTQGGMIAARKRDRARTETQLERLKLVIDEYKLRFGTYPPDNPADAADSRLYDELRGIGILNAHKDSNRPGRDCQDASCLMKNCKSKDYFPNLKPDESALINGVKYLAVPALPFPPGELIYNTNNYTNQCAQPGSSTYHIFLSQFLNRTAIANDHFLEVAVEVDPQDPYGPAIMRFLPFNNTYHNTAVEVVPYPAYDPNIDKEAKLSMYSAKGPNGRQRLVDVNCICRWTWIRSPNIPSANVWNYNSSFPSKNTASHYDLWLEYVERGSGKAVIIGNWK